ncbi:MAG: class I SAM-dependent methyltransferase [Nanoarchaeota archaeon]|nr:class I SAM-dependent methyltransferase [Nanoarchaeota archaeon]
MKTIYNQVSDLISVGSSVIDVGCGKGKLLISLSPKIDYGLGIDISERKVKIANKKNNLKFKIEDSSKLNSSYSFDYITSIFSIHTMNYVNQMKTLNNFSEIATNKIIVDFVKSKSRLKQQLICFDEILAGHYSAYKTYIDEGMNSLIKKSKLNLIKEIEGKYDFYKIWICN